MPDGLVLVAVPGLAVSPDGQTAFQQAPVQHRVWSGPDNRPGASTLGPAVDAERDRVVSGIIDELSPCYRGRLDTKQIAAVVNDTWNLLEGRSTVNSYLPILVTRRAREQLAALPPGADLQVAHRTRM